MRRPPIPEAELAAIRRSVWVAVHRASIARSAEGRRENRFRKKQGYTKKHFKADALLERLTFAPRPPLNDRDVMPIVCTATRRNDTRFFIRLGKVLARKPKPRSATLMEFLITVPPMQVQFLIGRWVDSEGSYGGLCRLTPEGLLAVLQHEFGHENVRMEVDGIVKLRQRLGLRPLRRPKVHVLLIGDELRYLD